MNCLSKMKIHIQLKSLNAVLRLIHNFIGKKKKVQIESRDSWNIIFKTTEHETICDERKCHVRHAYFVV